MLTLSYHDDTKTSSVELRYHDSPWQRPVNGRDPPTILCWIRAFIAVTWLSKETVKERQLMWTFYRVSECDLAFKKKSLKRLKMKYKHIIQTGSSNVTGSVVVFFTRFLPNKRAETGIWMQSVHPVMFGNPAGKFLYSQRWKQDTIKVHLNHYWYQLLNHAVRIHHSNPVKLFFDDPRVCGYFTTIIIIIILIIINTFLIHFQKRSRKHSWARPCFSQLCLPFPQTVFV